MPGHQQQTPQQDTESASIFGLELPDVGQMWSDFSTGWSNANDAAAMAAMQETVGNAALQEQLNATQVCEDESLDQGAVDVQTTYTVVAGDTLGKIAQKLGHPAGEYQLLYQANEHQLSSPNAVEVGQRLLLPEAWTGVAPDAACEVPEEVAEPGYAQKAGEALGGAYNSAEAAAGEVIGAANDAASDLWDWAFGEEEPVLEECPVEEGSDDILLDVPWFSQFYYYTRDGEILTDPEGHGEVQENGQPALHSDFGSDRAKALKHGGPFMFTPGQTSCNKASRAMVAYSGTSPSGAYDAVQVFYDGDEVDRESSSSRQKTELDRSDPEFMKEVAELTQAGVAYLDAELEEGRAVLVGVSYWESTYNPQDANTRTQEQGDPAHAGESRVDHFVTVVGREGDSYVFNDPGSRSSKNRRHQHFVLDQDGVLIRDPDEVANGGEAFEVSQIRRNQES